MAGWSWVLWERGRQNKVEQDSMRVIMAGIKAEREVGWEKTWYIV